MKGTRVWLIYSATDSNDPSPSCLGAWSTKEAAEAECTRLKATDHFRRDVIEIEEIALDQPWEYFGR